MKRRIRRLAAPLLLAGAMGALAAFVQGRARAAERKHPPLGRFVEADGVRLHYLERGRPGRDGGPALVLLHGNGAMIEDWIASGLLDEAAHQYRVIAFDRPGFGHTARPHDRDWTPQVQADAIHRALQKLGVDQAVVVGHSWGTLVALALALRHAAQVSGLVLLSGFYFPQRRADLAIISASAPPWVGGVFRHTTAPVLLALLGRKIVEKVFAPLPVPKRFWTDIPLELGLRPSQLRAAAEDTKFMLPAVAQMSRHYGALNMPTVIFGGAQDQIVNTSLHSVPLQRFVPGSRLHVVPGAGHMIHYAVRTEILRAIDDIVTHPERFLTARQQIGHSGA